MTHIQTTAPTPVGVNTTLVSADNTAIAIHHTVSHRRDDTTVISADTMSSASTTGGVNTAIVITNTSASNTVTSLVDTTVLEQTTTIRVQTEAGQTTTENNTGEYIGLYIMCHLIMDFTVYNKSFPELDNGPALNDS